MEEEDRTANRLHGRGVVKVRTYKHAGETTGYIGCYVFDVSVRTHYYKAANFKLAGQISGRPRTNGATKYYDILWLDSHATIGLAHNNVFDDNLSIGYDATG